MTFPGVGDAEERPFSSDTLPFRVFSKDLAGFVTLRCKTTGGTLKVYFLRKYLCMFCFPSFGGDIFKIADSWAGCCEKWVDSLKTLTENS